MNIVEGVELEKPGQAPMLKRLRRNWKWPAAGLVAGLVVAFVYLNFATYEYAASYRVTPVRSDGPGLSGGLSSLAAAAGVSVGRGEAAKPFTLYLNLLKSRDVAAELAKDEALMRGAFASSWDESTGQWRQPPSRTRWLRTLVRQVAGAPVKPWRPPDAASMQTWLQDHVSVSDDQRNAIATISTTNENPQFAIALLTALDEHADQLVRQRSLARAEASIAYLQSTLPTVVLAEHRAALADALGEQERVKMMSMSSASFAAEPLGAIVATPDPVTPSPLLTIGALSLLGLLVGALVAVNRKGL